MLYKFWKVLLLVVIATVLFAGCNSKPSESESTGWTSEIPNTEDEAEPTETPVAIEEPDTEEPDTEEPDTEEPDTEEPDIEGEVDTGYKSVDLTLGRPMSALYTYTYTNNSDLISEVTPSTKYEGLFEGRSTEGKSVLLAPDFTPLEYPDSEDFKVLEPFLFENNIYFRVADINTDWQEIPECYHNLWWKPLGGYAVLDIEGKESIVFGAFDYIDRFVEGKARAYKVEDNNYYIIDVTGTVLKTYPIADKVAPYKLYPDGFIYTRSDVDTHSHALMSWDGTVVIPYGVYKDDFFPKYLGDGRFLVNNDLLLDGTQSGLILYSVDKSVRKLPKNSYDIFTGLENKFVTGMITNGLAGPLAKWEYIVTDYEGKTLIEQGKYSFTLGGWGDGYAVARNKSGKLVLLDSACKEVDLPEYMELTGRYSYDAALFTVKVTKDFEMWRYANVPSRYDNPVGVVDKEFNWVIPPGEVDYLRNLPKQTINILSEYKQGEATKNSTFIQILPLK